MERKSEVFFGSKPKNHKQKFLRENQKNFLEFLEKFSADFHRFSTRIGNVTFRQKSTENSCEQLLTILRKPLVPNQIILKETVDKP